MPDIFSILGWVLYTALGLLALWGAYCVVLVWLRVSHTQMRDEEELDEFMDMVEDKILNGDFDGVLQECEGDRRAMVQLTAFAVENRDLGYGPLKRRVVERFQQDVMNDIEHRLSWVGTVTKSAPMVGLLGTVIGMMGAFAKIGGGGDGPVDPTAMAKDIQVALITTACGLAIAVPLVLMTASINIRIRKMEDLIDLGLAGLFDVLKQKLGGAPPKIED